MEGLGLGDRAGVAMDALFSRAREESPPPSAAAPASPPRAHTSAAAAADAAAASEEQVEQAPPPTRAHLAGMCSNLLKCHRSASN